MSEQGYEEAVRQLNIAEAASRKDWTQDRVDEAINVTETGQSKLDHYESAEKQADDPIGPRATDLALAQAAEKAAKLANMQNMAAQADWSQERVDQMTQKIESEYAPQ